MSLLQAAAVEPEAPQMMELDSWIVDFAHLFREHCGLDIDKHLDLNNVAWDRIQVSYTGTRRNFRLRSADLFCCPPAEYICRVRHVGSCMPHPVKGIAS